MISVDELRLTGKIYDIQPFSVQDGPGIRTTVFLKGCPLRCPWCHSPESQEFGTELCWMETRCIGTEKCGECIKNCPQQCISEGALVETPGSESKHLIRTDYSRCVGCGTCARSCIPSALYFCGADYTVEEVLERLIKDKTFFEHSNGGMTISGGECLCQPKFTTALLKASKDAGIHTAVDTTGFVDWKIIEGVLPYTDLFLYDLKHMNSEKHKQVIQVPNDAILANALHIAASGGKFQIRIPLIPGFNDDEENIAATGAFVQKLGASVQTVQLLPYHELGTVKWNRLQRRPPDFCTQPPSSELVDARKKLLESFGLNVIIH